jgi:hypothetical protein
MQPLLGAQTYQRRQHLDPKPLNDESPHQRRIRLRLEVLEVFRECRTVSEALDDVRRTRA